jgi:hypothetical protein
LWRKKSFLAFASVLLVLALFLPLGLRLWRLAEEERAVEEVLAQGREAARKLQEVSAQEDRIRSQLQAERSLSAVLQKLVAARAVDVTLAKITPDQLHREGELLMLPLAVEYLGSYPALLETMERLSSETAFLIRTCSFKEDKGSLKASVLLWVPWGDGP